MMMPFFAAGLFLWGCSTSDSEPTATPAQTESAIVNAEGGSAAKTDDNCVWAGDNPTANEFQQAFEKYDGEMGEVNQKYGGQGSTSGLSPTTQYQLDVVRDMPSGAAHAYTVAECAKMASHGSSEFSEDELASVPANFADLLRESKTVNDANPGFFVLNGGVGICALGAELPGNPIPGGPEVRDSLVAVLCPQYL